MRTVIVVALLVAYVAVTVVGPAVVAKRKGRSFGWWLLGGAVGGLAALILAALASPGGEPWRVRAPLALGVFTLVFAGPLVLLAVVAQVT
jgi:hypothetical protein